MAQVTPALGYAVRMSDITPDPTYRRELKERVRITFALADWWVSRSEETREAVRQNDYQPTNIDMAESVAAVVGVLTPEWELGPDDSEALRQIDLGWPGA